MTFWVRGSAATTLDVAGFANDNTGTSRHEAGVNGIPITTSWSKVILPIPLPARLTNEGGLFWFADAVEGSDPVDIWFDDVRFESVSVISSPRPRMATRNVGAFVGGEVDIVGTRTTFAVNGQDLVVDHLPGYFDYISSDETVVVAEEGRVRLVGGGEAVVTAKLGAVDVEGELTVAVTVPPSEPAPAPTFAASDVVSVFSNAYDDVAVRTFSADWDVADVTDLRIDGDDVKAYTNLSFAGIEIGTESATIDATDLTHFHMDVWIPSGTFFRIKIVDFGEDGLFGMAPDSEHELTLTTSSEPAIEPGAWASLDIPLDNFTQLRTRGHIAQIIVSGNSGTVYVDNILFHR